MKLHSLLRAWPLLLLIILANYLVLRYLNYSYPIVGHDFYYVLPRMVDARIYYLVNGLGIQWYTPTFGGGVPAFPNPVYTQFSLHQFMTFFFGLWTSVEMTIVFACTIGAVFTYLLLRKNFELSKVSSLLGTAGFVVNGFTINQMMSGHLPYHILLFLPLVVYVFSQPVANPLLIVCTTGFVYAFSVYSGGGDVLIASGLSFIICALIFRKMRLDKVRFWSYVAGGVLSVFLAAAKLNAMASFMKRFPREIEGHSANSLIEGLAGLGAQILGFPFFRLLGMQSLEILTMYVKLNNNPWGLWEHDVYLAFPLILTIFFALVVLFSVSSERSRLKSWWKTLTWQKYLGFFVLWFTIELIMSYGFLFNLISGMPVISSFHVTIRFTSALILPLCIAAAMAYNFLENRYLKTQMIKGIAGAAVLALVFLNTLAYEFRGPEDKYLQTFSVERIVETFENVNQGHLYPVKNFNVVPDDNVFLSNTSSARPYEPIFRGNIEKLTANLHAGPVSAILGEYYNLTNPASMVFPEENGLELYERIRLSDRDNMERFINRKATTWKISTRQKFANGLTLLSFLALACSLIYLLKQRISQNEN